MTYKITIKNHLKALHDIPIFIIIVCFFYYVNYRFNIYKVDILWFLIWFSFGNFLLVLILHLEYYYYNHKSELRIDEISKKVIYKNKLGEITVYDFADIKEITIYMFPSLARKSDYRMMPIELYHYASIYTHDGTEIVFTSLMDCNVEDAMRQITGVPIIVRWNLYPSRKLRKLMWGK